MSLTAPARRSLTAAQVAERLNIYTEHGKPNEQGVYRMARLGVLPVVRIGRIVRFDEDAIEAWIAAGGSNKSA